jgi:hypothetical protein
MLEGLFDGGGVIQLPGRLALATGVADDLVDAAALHVLPPETRQNTDQPCAG